MDVNTFVISHGRSLIPKMYLNITDEINHRKFATRTKGSYGHIPEYYTLPINTPYIDKGPGPYHPYARYSKNSHPRWATSDQTPELLLEPFGDPLMRSWSTIAEMVDMHYKKMSFVIVKDDDVVTIYLKLFYYLDNMRAIRFPKSAQSFVDLLNRTKAFHDELKYLYLSICKKRHITYVKNTYIQFIEKQAVKV